MEPDDEDDRALDAQVDGQADEGEPDHPHRPALPFFAYVRQFPQDDGGCANLNQAVQPESGECNGSGLHRGKRQHEHTHDVPAERRRLQPATPAEEPGVTGPIGGVLHGASVADRVAPPSPSTRRSCVVTLEA